MQKVIFQLDTLTCPSCVSKIESALKTARGVSAAQVRFHVSKVVIEFDRGLTDEPALQSLLTKLGYRVLGYVSKELKGV